MMAKEKTQRLRAIQRIARRIEKRGIPRKQAFNMAAAEHAANLVREGRK